MMPSLNPMDRFKSLIGGEENLPPKTSPPPKPQPEEEEEPAPQNEVFDRLLSVEQVIGENAGPRPEQCVQLGVQPITPITAKPSQDVMSEELSLDSRAGEPAPQGMSFSPFLAVTKFCYKFVSEDYRQPLATAFFDANKIWSREWDLYYVHSGYYPGYRAVTFVPEHQLQTLLDEINQAFPRADIKLTDELRAEGLTVDFDDLPEELRPRWLGRSRSREQHDTWMFSLPQPKSAADSDMADSDLKKFREMMEKAAEVSKAKSKAKKKAQSHESTLRKVLSGKQVLRAQRYLGLLPKTEEDLIGGVSNLSISAIDQAKPPPYPFEQDAIIIAIDCEAYERTPKVVTEIGLATIDTRDLQGQAPGEAGVDWHKHIRPRHFRISEHKHLVNHLYCKGAPDQFDYGQSEFIDQQHIASELTKCFHQPYSKREADGSLSLAGWTDGVEEKRNIILLGHDLTQDITYLHSIGFSVTNRGNLLEALDSAEMFRAYTRDANITTLSNVCYHFDLVTWHPHNAGNDAVHTVWGFLAVAVKDAAQRGDDALDKERALRADARTNRMVEKAKKKGERDAREWAALEDDDGDGGPAVAPNEKYELRKAKDGRAIFGPAKPPSPSASGGLFTEGGAPLDV